MMTFVDHQQLLDPSLVEDAPGHFLAGAETDSRQILLGHQLADRLLRIFGEANVAIGQDARQLARFLDDRNAADTVGPHQLKRLGQRLVGRHGDRVDDHPALEPFDRTDRRRLLFNIHVAMENADAAKVGHGNRHVRFGHRIHRRRQDRDVERDFAGQKGAGICAARQHARFKRLEQDVVERQSKRDFIVEKFSHARLWQTSRDSPRGAG